MAAVTVEGAVVEEKVDEEIPQEKVDIVAKKFDTEEPESAGGCDVCLPPNGLWDTTFQTPYAIGTIAALFLHLLLPEDRVLDEEKEGYPRAFSDGEIAYES